MTSHQLNLFLGIIGVGSGTNGRLVARALAHFTVTGNVVVGPATVIRVIEHALGATADGVALFGLCATDQLVDVSNDQVVEAFGGVDHVAKLAGGLFELGLTVGNGFFNFTTDVGRLGKWVISRVTIVANGSLKLKMSLNFPVNYSVKA